METRAHVTPMEHLRRAEHELADDVRGIIHRFENETVDKAKLADKFVRNNPYKTIGVMFGLGLLAGYFLLRRR